MTRKQKEKAIKKLVYGMLWNSHKEMRINVEQVMKSGAIDIDEWDDKNAPMITPKCIVTAVLEHEKYQYIGTGTAWEKTVKNQVKNIQYFL